VQTRQFHLVSYSAENALASWSYSRLLGGWFVVIKGVGDWTKDAAHFAVVDDFGNLAKARPGTGWF
jgi:hypothetical protein